MSAPDRLAAVFPPTETTVVLYIREQVDYLISGYAQRVQATDLCVTFEEYADQHRNAVNYLPWLRRFERAFGRANMVVRVYDRDLLVGGSTLTDFVSALGLGELPIEKSSGVDANPSLDFASLRLKLLGERTWFREHPRVEARALPHVPEGLARTGFARVRCGDSAFATGVTTQGLCEEQPEGLVALR